ncbi:hypothetical protein [Actinacidiphila glaucinigra]|uniref:DUF3558 domain-containing protein n=1 Tax=Actinacidiphila glaucinigra TaxID=235986 RepID=A0A239G4Z3_9ACTN|nr:hypothetical protein [Actinacidiphila glaucinigra]SNS63553.1 hypothetical protein SAMN05216252_107208 [Actinacidiphila glaucinigra]
MVHTRSRTGSGDRRRTRALAGVPVAALLVLALQGCQDPAADDAGGKPSATAPGGAGAEGSPAAPSGQPSASPPGGTADGDPCALVTQQEAERLAGTALKPGQDLEGTCTYPAPESGPTAQVEVFAGESGKNYYDAERGLGHELKPLDGIGDEAWLEDGSVFLRVSGQWVAIRLVRNEEPSRFDKPLEELARTVAGRL